MIKVFCDSSTQEACFIIEGQEPKRILYPTKVTVNVGEYESVILALLEVISQRLKGAVFYTDSQLVVMQVNREWAVRKRHLLPYRGRVWELMRECGAELRWIPREENPAGFLLEKL